MNNSTDKAYFMRTIVNTYELLRTEYWAFFIILGMIFIVKYLGS